MDLLRKVGCTMSCVLLLLLSAVPANAADLDVPDWYGGAVRAFDRMGSTTLELPWWINKNTARQVLQLKDDATLTIDAKLNDTVKRKGYPLQSDFDKALAGHDSVIQYQDAKFEVRTWLNLLGQTFADGYADSSNGSKVYGDVGYIPTAEEIDEESMKLAHTSSYLLKQAKNFDYDATSTKSTKTSSCRALGTVMNAVDRAWKNGVRTPGTYAVAERDPEYGDVITYDPKEFKNYDALSVLDRDNGTLYYDQVINQMQGKNKSVVNYQDLKTSAVVGGRKAQAKQWAGKAKEFGKQAGKQGLLNMVDTFVGSMISDGARKVLDMTVGLDNWCDSMIGLGAGNWAMKALGYIDNKVVGTVTGVDCDNYVPQGTAASTRQFGKAKKDLSGGSDDSIDTSSAPSWKRSWLPWYHVTTTRATLYFRFQFVQDGKGREFVDLGRSQIASSFPTNYLDGDTYLGSGNDWTDKAALYLFFPHAQYNGQNVYVSCNTQVAWSNSCYYSQKTYVESSPGEYTPVFDSALGAMYNESDYASDPLMAVAGLGLATGGQVQDRSSEEASALYVKGSVDWVLNHLIIYEGRLGPIYDFVENENSVAFSRLASMQDTYRLTKCDDSCPEAYQPSEQKTATTTTTVTDSDGTQHVSSLDGQDLNNGGLLPRHIQAGLKDDGTIGGTLSYGAQANGKTSDLGSMTLDGIYPNNVGKRLDLIDTVTGKSCFSEGYACADWVKETQTLVPDHQLDVNFKGTTKEYPNLKYKCSYDVPGKITEVPLGECIAYAPQFKPEAQKSGQTTGQPDGSTSTNTTTKPDNSYSWDSCVKSATAENAAAWLYSPITCAAHQLFIPDEKVMTTTATKFQHDTSDGIMPQFRELQTNWGALFDSFGGGCHGIKVSFGWGDIKVFDDAEFLNACPGTQLEFLPTLAKAGITVGLAIMAFSICRKAVMAIFDFQVPDSGGE